MFFTFADTEVEGYNEDNPNIVVIKANDAFDAADKAKQWAGLVVLPPKEKDSKSGEDFPMYGSYRFGIQPVFPVDEALYGLYYVVYYSKDHCIKGRLGY